MRTPQEIIDQYYALDTDDKQMLFVDRLTSIAKFKDEED